jgi:flavin-dependent dehydrogenase
MRRQPLIIGAGPAGTAAAIRLAQAGHRPMLLDRAAGPTDKVCGDFLGVDGITRLRALGVDPFSLGAAPIHLLRLVHGARAAQTSLPFQALGLSRRVLDGALFNRALLAGADARRGATVRRIEPLAEHQASLDGLESKVTWRLTLGHGETIDSGDVFLATGKHDLRDLTRPGAKQGAIGLKMYYDLGAPQTSALAGAIELFLFPGGYAGLQCVEAGKSVLCIALQRSRFPALGGTWKALLNHLVTTTPALRERLATAKPLLARPLAVAGVPYGFLHRDDGATPGLYRVGDQAAVIPSLTGDGIAIALHTGTMAAQAWLDGEPAAAYHRRLAAELRGQMRLANLLHRLAMAGPGQAAGVRAAGWFPGLPRLAATGTRIRHPVAAHTNARTSGLHPA